MQVKHLLQLAQAAAYKNPDAIVKIYWDYAPRSDIEGAYFNKDGDFVLAGESDYDVGDNPSDILYEKP